MFFNQNPSRALYSGQRGGAVVQAISNHQIAQWIGTLSQTQKPVITRIREHHSRSLEKRLKRLATRRRTYSTSDGCRRRGLRRTARAQRDLLRGPPPARQRVVQTALGATISWDALVDEARAAGPLKP